MRGGGWGQCGLYVLITVVCVIATADYHCVVLGVVAPVWVFRGERFTFPHATAGTQNKRMPKNEDFGGLRELKKKKNKRNKSLN